MYKDEVAERLTDMGNHNSATTDNNTVKHNDNRRPTNPSNKARSGEFLDLEDNGNTMRAELQAAKEHKQQEIHEMIQNAMPEQLDLMLEALRKSAGNIQGQATATMAV